jgi:hypothetical protein
MMALGKILRRFLRRIMSDALFDPHSFIPNARKRSGLSSESGCASAIGAGGLLASEWGATTFVAPSLIRLSMTANAGLVICRSGVSRANTSRSLRIFILKILEARSFIHFDL